MKLTVGDETALWNKVMKEVKLKCFCGPYENIPFEWYIQSPIGLVPKDNGKETRLIFHLSYPRNVDPEISVNGNIPEQFCSVKYHDLSRAVNLCMREGKNCHIG